jgi:hypothetical protein
MRDAEPWPEAVIGEELLDELSRVLARHVVLPEWAADTLALWCVHTYAFELREVGTYIGVESPEKRCGKTTLLTVLGRLVRRPVVAANISSSAFFRVIEETRPTLLIDEADTFLHGNEEIRGILNAGYHRDSAYVLRVCAGQEAGEEGGTRLARFSCWCPKVMCLIGRLPDTLADRCIVIRMQRKRPDEDCERLRGLKTEELRRKCARFAADNARRIAEAEPEVPGVLHDRAGDVWEPLLALADAAGGEWPKRARQAAIGLTMAAEERYPMATLLFDAYLVFALKEKERMFSRELVAALNERGERPWWQMRKGKEVTEAWLAGCLRPYGMKPATMRIGEEVGRGYAQEEFTEAIKRYVPKAEVRGMVDEIPRKVEEPASPPEGEQGHCHLS